MKVLGVDPGSQVCGFAVVQIADSTGVPKGHKQANSGTPIGSKSGTASESVAGSVSGTITGSVYGSRSVSEPDSISESETISFSGSKSASASRPVSISKSSSISKPISGSGIRPLSIGVLQAKGTSYQDRVLQLGQDFRELLKKHSPSHVAFEKVFLGKNPDSAFKLGQARGVLFYLALEAGCLCYEYSTRTIKKSISGSGAADKLQVRSILEAQFNIRLSQSLLDCSDALAVAVHHCYHFQSPAGTLGLERWKEL